MENIKVNSVSEAWRTAERIFPTDYEKNEESSKRAGYANYIQVALLYYSCPQEGSYNFQKARSYL